MKQIAFSCDRYIIDKIDEIAYDMNETRSATIRNLVLKALDQDDDGFAMLSLRDCAAMVGLPIDTVRQAIVSGEIDATRGSRGEHNVNPQALLRWVRSIEGTRYFIRKG
jgi:hypothetical protein